MKKKIGATFELVEGGKVWINFSYIKRVYSYDGDRSCNIIMTDIENILVKGALKDIVSKIEKYTNE